MDGIVAASTLGFGLCTGTLAKPTDVLAPTLHAAQTCGLYPLVQMTISGVSHPVYVVEPVPTHALVTVTMTPE